MKNNQNGDAGVALAIILGIIAIVAVIGLGMWGIPQYGVYSARKDGEAVLAHAQYSREVAVAEAKAKMESASLLADAEVSRAGGVAKANAIIGESLKDNEAYLRYLWIVDVAGSQNEKTVVYVPTEGNLPILEAARLHK